MPITLTVYNQEGKKNGSQDVPEAIFDLKENNSLVHQVYTIKLANSRKTIAHTKDRSEVRGGGRKPWRQKGTGRARHGSIRSPLWVGGGITFGPRNERVFAKKVNKKMRQKAIAIVLSSKARENSIYIIDSLDFSDPKTKYASKLLDAINKDHKSSLIWGTKDDKNFTRVFKNISYVKPVNINRVNIIDILHNKNCIISKKALQMLISSYSNNIKNTDSIESKVKKVASDKSKVSVKKVLK